MSSVSDSIAFKKYYRKAKRNGICTKPGCGDPATHGTLCSFHREKVRRENRLRYRRKNGIFIDDDVLIKSGRRHIINSQEAPT